MANPEHVEILKQGVDVWNWWRKDNPDIKPDLREADLFATDLVEANLTKADLQKADLSKANLLGADLSEALLGWANLAEADLFEAKLYHANLRWAVLDRADLFDANLSESDLFGADLSDANLNYANLSNANLSEANLKRVSFVETILDGADLSNSMVYGLGAWNIKTNKKTVQLNLVITKEDQPIVTTDDIELAQFIYLLLNNSKIRNVIDTIGQKGVLIIGRFTDERIAVLHAIRDELRRKYGLLPIIFEFDPLSNEPTLKTLSTLAHLSRFVIADLTDAKSVLQELTMILKDLPTLPVKPIIHESDDLPPMGDSFLIMQSMLKPYIYSSQNKLLEDFKVEVIDPAEACIKRFEAQLADIRQQWFPWQQK